MHRLKKKLSGRAGSSMILALVFLLFSVFVGGSVLTAATVNANRIKNDSDQQAYLDERSAAYLLVDLLKCDPAKLPEMTVITETVTTIPIMGEPDIKINTTITFPDSQEALSQMQTLLYQSAVFRYIALNEANINFDTFKVKHDIKDVASGSTSSDPLLTIQNLNDFTNYWVYKTGDDYSECAKCELELTEKDSKIPKCTLVAECASGDALTLYDFEIHLETQSQLSVHMDANVSSGDVTRLPVQITADGKRIETEIRNMNVYWENPVIMKGGSSR